LTIILFLAKYFGPNLDGALFSQHSKIWAENILLNKYRKMEFLATNYYFFLLILVKLNKAEVCIKKLMMK